ncbi:phthiocerol/phthiodiolone dimycocerosyl transferase family protein [Streptomyces griseus]|uniref:phthiocerol/phthiodiolone dimycocerosyl transferase family protein n=1 Tax=Streptomyces griseus TaxID=1911 RepID=UPI00083FE719|nr:peptide synthetase [Streptomyces griseus]
MSISHAHAETVRELGAFERAIDLYMHRNPVQFSLVAEIDRKVSEQTLARALRGVQARHPLLRVSVDRRPPLARYRWAEGPVRVETVAEGTPWQAVVAGEQTRPLPVEPGPLMRSVLIPSEADSVIVLTFAHQITDGIGGMQVLTDLVTALDADEDGGEPTSDWDVPPSQETLLRTLDTATPPVGPPQDELMNAPGELTQFSGRAPHVSSLALQRGTTARLVTRCRSNGVSVHAALCAAACTVFHRAGRTRVRVLSPIDLRRAVDLPDAVANRFAGARTASEMSQAGDFWELARHHHQALGRLRAPQVLKAGSEALDQQTPRTPEEAEAMMTVATAADIQITNLGVVEAPAHDGTGLTALWGPAQTTQLRGEHVLGVTTFGGRLRMTELTHGPLAVLLPDMATVLAQQCVDPDSSVS